MIKMMKRKMLLVPLSTSDMAIKNHTLNQSIKHETFLFKPRPHTWPFCFKNSKKRPISRKLCFTYKPWDFEVDQNKNWHQTKNSHKQHWKNLVTSAQKVVWTQHVTMDTLRWCRCARTVLATLLVRRWDSERWSKSTWYRSNFNIKHSFSQRKWV